MFGAHGLVGADFQTIVFEYEYKYDKYLDVEFVTRPGNFKLQFYNQIINQPF